MGSTLVFPAPKDKNIPRSMESRLKYFTKPRDFDDAPTVAMPFICYGERKRNRKIPYLHFSDSSAPNNSKYLIIYFHGNSELLSQAYRTLEKYHSVLEVKFS